MNAANKPNHRIGRRNIKPAVFSGKSNTKPKNNKRRNNRGAVSITGPKIRTPHTIVSALARATASMSLDSDDAYTKARMGCCYLRLPPAIPDGNSGRCIRVCHYALDRISLPIGATAAKTIRIQLQPWIPMGGAIVSTDGSIIFNGNNIGAIDISTDPWLSVGVPAPYNTASYTDTLPGSVALAMDPYSVTQGRIVSASYKLIYTGPVQTAAGVVRAFPNQVSLGAYTSTNNGSVASPTVPPGITISSINMLTGSINNTAPNATPILNWDGSLTPNPPPGTLSTRPEQGITIRLQRSGNTHKQIPYATPSYAVSLNYLNFNGNNSNSNNAFGIVNTAAYKFGGGLSLFDNDWLGQQLMLDNINADASYQLETCICMEYTPQSNSTMQQMASDPPSTNPGAIAKVQRQLAEQGSALAGV